MLLADFHPLRGDSAYASQSSEWVLDVESLRDGFAFNIKILSERGNGIAVAGAAGVSLTKKKSLDILTFVRLADVQRFLKI
jgi:hypothetical protein